MIYTNTAELVVLRDIANNVAGVQHEIHSLHLFAIGLVIGLMLAYVLSRKEK